MRHELLGELRLVMKHAHNGGLVEPHDDAFRHCHYRRQAQLLARQTALAEEIPDPVAGDYRFLSLFGYYADLDVALLNEKDGIRRIALPEDLLILSIFGNGPATVNGGEKRFDVEGRLPLGLHDKA